jgi:hypothetical protein
MKRPNFFIIGAPKCGTTSLSFWLSCHPNIFIPSIKEPHYFNFDFGPRYIKKKVDYLKLYDEANDSHSAIGEATTRYLFSRAAVPEILKFADQPRFIVMLRNPIEMAHSLHDEEVYSGYENVKDFKMAWDLQKNRRNGNNVPLLCPDQAILQYGDICKVGAQLKRLLIKVKRNRVLFLTLDDLKSNPKGIYTEVLKFLKVKDDDRSLFPVKNIARSHSNTFLKYLSIGLVRMKTLCNIKHNFGVQTLINKKNTVIRKRTKLEDAFYNTLVDYFMEDIKLTEGLTKKNLNHWLLRR